MSRRSLLRKQLTTAWHETIDNAYSRQLVNSERGLQVHFCRYLLDEFAKANIQRRLFIEPRISSSGTQVRRYPDIVICNTRHIIGVMEIKYQPRGDPSYEKDFDTLKWIRNHSRELTLSNDRYLGIMTKGKTYSLAPDAVLCWAGVYKGPEATIKKSWLAHFGVRLLSLHAITAPDMPPIVLPKKS